MSIHTLCLCLVGFYFVSVILLSLFKSVYIPGRAIFLFRAFLPSWKFFEDLGEVPRLSWRVRLSDEEFGNWQMCPNQTSRKWSSLFLNSRGNYLLATGSLLQQFISDLEELPESDTEELIFQKAQQTVSYQLIKNLIEFEFESAVESEVESKVEDKGDWADQNIFEYQFKIEVEHQLSYSIEHVLMSPVYRVSHQFPSLVQESQSLKQQERKRKYYEIYRGDLADRKDDLPGNYFSDH